MRIPRATYRVQLSKDFDFADAARLVPYLAELGISDLYASPYTKARSGSTHGYDVVDPNALNPEIGSGEDYEDLVRALRRHGMGQLLDIVPNHMGVGPDNPWWMDVLEHGPASVHARFFDVDWYPADRSVLHGKILLPVLGDHYRAVLQRGELGFSFDAHAGAFSVSYYEHRCPLDPRTYPMFLDALDGVPQDENALELESLVTAFGKLPRRDDTDDAAVEERARDAEINKRRLARLCAESAEVRRAVEERVRALNEPGKAAGGSEAMHRVLQEQAYRLVYWRAASDEINYRRFFAINDLAGVRVEDEAVFDATHGLVLDLVRSGKVQGLRIDHPDGLHDPAGYFRRLQHAATEALGPDGPLYVLVEKILAHHERLPEDWPVAGTTGYEFTNLVNGLFVDPAGEEGIDRAYRCFLGGVQKFEDVLYACKKLVMRDDLASELNVLVRRLLAISEGLDGRRSHDFTAHALRDALTEVVAEFPVYRTYVSSYDGISETDARYMEWAVARARKRSAAADTTVFDFIRDTILHADDGAREQRAAMLAFVMKLQQYTGPVMAKGMEDTALYRFNRLASLNEVGGEPERFGVSVAAFHHENAERARTWPNAMLSSSTHDTKRGEDVRARINVLSEMPGEWRAALARWGRLNRSRRRLTEAGPAPSRNDEYLFYETLLGAWPLRDPKGDGSLEFAERMKAYMEKAMREARLRTSWTKPDEEYEEAVAAFVEATLAPGDNLFLQDFLSFQRVVSRLGALNSLSQTLLKLTAPGVPDVYQGNDLWDLSLVDPDNRRPVDYDLRRESLAAMKALDPADASSLLGEDAWRDGRAKLYATWRELELRRERPRLFESGGYVPLEASGARSDHLVAFARLRGKEATITAAPRLFAGLVGGDGPLTPKPEAWSDTVLEFPEELSGLAFRNVFTGETIASDKGVGETSLRVDALLRGFPVALLATDG